MEVRTLNTVKALQAVAKTDPDSVKYLLQNWKLQQNMAKSSIKELKQMNFYILVINNKLFSYKLYIALKEMGFDNSKMDTYDFEDWMPIAFKIHNDNAKKLIEFLISGQSPKINLNEIISNLNYQIDWPRDWQDIRSEVKKKYIELDLENKSAEKYYY